MRFIGSVCYVFACTEAVDVIVEPSGGYHLMQYSVNEVEELAANDVEEDRKKCRPWCNKDAKKQWAEKCKMSACGGCKECQTIAHIECPGLYDGTPQDDSEPVPTPEAYDAALEALDLEAVKKDIEALMTDSHPCWPADGGNYGPFFVRLAWHCSGTFRHADGAGGCAGGRQRFEPERSWDDNTNLDKARALLAPIKKKYGIGLSWGDLFVLAGTQSMRAMGAPLKRFCAGRIDDPDGQKSSVLGPTPEQETVAPCTGEQGDCQRRANETTLATVQVGLIYVNPEGKMGVPDPRQSVEDIRTVFQKMGSPNDRSTVALIGGGHAFGKAHGACSDKVYDHPAGMPPSQAFKHGTAPYMGKCPPTASGEATWTSGFEGSWTSTPAKWSNEYFRYLLEYEWEKYVGPGGHWQWRIRGQPDMKQMRLTSDLALIHDESFRQSVEEFAANQTALDLEFEISWYMLTHGGGQWSQKRKCDEFVLPPAAMLETDIN